MKKTCIELAIKTGIYLINMALNDNNWLKKINLDKLDLNDENNDILGQLFGSRKKGFSFLQNIPTRNPEILEEPMYNGLIPSIYYSADELKKIWKNMINELAS